jgi:hypothetical protein
MAASEVLVQTQREYSLAVAPLAVSSVELLRYVNAAAWVSGLFIVTLYSKGSWASEVWIDFAAMNVTRAKDDPANLYQKGSNAGISILSSHAAPKLYTASLTAPLGDELRILFMVNNDEATAQQVDFTVGVKLVGRDA